MKTRAALSVAYGQPLLVDEIDLADPVPEHVLVKQFASGICHSQLHGLHNPSSPRPSVPGHESTGLAVRAGANVTHVKEGDHVMLTWLPRAPFEGMGRFMVTGLSYKGQEIELNNSLAPTFTWPSTRWRTSSTSYPWTKTSTRSSRRSLIRFTTSSTCVSRLVSGDARCTRSPRPVWLGE